MWFGKNDDEHWERYDSLKMRFTSEMDALRAEIAKFQAEREKANPHDVAGRLADLEVKMAKLWALVVETSPTSGKDKLSKYGRKLFGGRAFRD